MSPGTRREFLSALSAASLALLLAAPRMLGAADVPRRPSFLFVLTDDQRWDAMSCVQQEMGDKARFPWLRTPNMDRVASEGIRFRNAFVVNSLCSPSRASFLTGCYGHVNGIVNNHTPFDARAVTFATLLREAGYATGYVGKWHMGSQAERPGFDYVASYIGQGIYEDCPFLVNGQQTSTKGWVDDVATDYALEFIRANRERPFVLSVGFKSAHGPFTPPERHATLYAEESARWVPNFAAPAIYRGPGAAGGGAPDEKGNVRTNLGYFRCLGAADENLGRLLDELDKLKIAEDTVVVFAGDNGFYLGEHGLGDKRTAYDESLRIPFLVRYPRLAARGRLEDRMVLNTDLTPTFLDLAGVAVPPAMHGRSLRPLLENRDAEWRRAFFYCYFQERQYPSIPTATAVRTETAKLIRYPGHDEWTEVFDLRQDPYELRNLAAAPEAAALRQELELEYARQAEAVAFRIPDFADKADDSRPPPRSNATVLEFRFDAAPADPPVPVADTSPTKAASETKGDLGVAAGRDGGKARRFDGQTFVEIGRLPALDPSRGPWTAEAVVRAEKADGVVLARGGRTNGYCLFVREGKPGFAVATGNRLAVARADESVLGRWVTLSGRITADRGVVLEVDGRPAARAKLPDFITADPNEPMQIGADEQTPVLDAETLPRFTGLMESVRLIAGEGPAKKP